MHAVDATVRSQNLESRFDIIERIPSSPGPAQLIPIRFVRAKKPNNLDKLMLAFDALLLSETIGRGVDFGRIIHGDDHTSVRIKTTMLVQQVRNTIEKIRQLLQAGSVPDLVLNRRCAECEFQGRCRQKAIEIDDLSLFSGMSPEERDRHRRKGIFTVKQLSYTFSPRRPPKRAIAVARPHYFALQALAIRENTVYIHGSPQLPVADVSVYLDIEGLSTSGPYYLLGVLIVSEEQEQFHSFWANQPADEIAVFTKFIDLVSQFGDFRVFHYGAYDVAALKLVRPKVAEHLRSKIDLILQRAVNVLSIVHQHVYFPTYTNGLKDLGQFIGCERTAQISNGLHSIVWRHRWEVDPTTDAKEGLVRYNKDDCFALRRLCDFIQRLATPNQSSGELKTARADALSPEETFRGSFGRKKFALADLEYVTKCAYFDYEREKVLFRTHPHLRPEPKASPRIDPQKLRPKATVLIPERAHCPNCGRKRIERKKLVSYFLVDLKFMRSGVKKFITKVSWWRCRCVRFNRTFSAGAPTGRIKFGRSLQVWSTYWSVVRGLQLERIRASLPFACRTGN